MHVARRPARLLTLGTLLGVLWSALAFAAGEPVPRSVRITSPLGRTGSFESVRIVAQVRGPEDAFATPPTVKFFIDGAEVGQDSDGAPYAIEWIDENPFERREIAVEVTDAKGRHARDQLVLDPFEVTEVSEVSSVVLEAAVEDKDGKPVRPPPTRVGATLAVVLLLAGALASSAVPLLPRLGGLLALAVGAAAAPGARPAGSSAAPAADTTVVRISL